MRDRSEVVAKVRVHHLSPSVLRHVPEHASERHLGVQLGAEPVLLRQEVRLEDGADDQHCRHLHNTVADGWNAERPLASVALRYPHTQKGPRGVHPRFQLLPQRFQPALNAPSFDHLERFAIHPRRAGILAASAVGFSQDIVAIDLVPKGVEAEGRFGLSFRL